VTPNNIADIFGEKYQYRIDFKKGDIDPPLRQSAVGTDW